MLRDGEDFDALVLAIPLGMAPIVCARADRGSPRVARAWSTHVTTTATQALQLWLRDDEPALGWHRAGRDGERLRVAVQHVGVDAAAASRSRSGRTHDRPGIDRVLLRGARRPAWPPDAPAGRVRRGAPGARCAPTPLDLVEHDLAHLLPGTSAGGAFRWDLLCGATGTRAARAIDTQLCLANVDPSDRYVQCSPGSDALPAARRRERLRQPVLAGDWTDNGLNAGCIEAAVAVRPAGRQRGPRPVARPPDRGYVAHVTGGAPDSRRAARGSR